MTIKSTQDLIEKLGGLLNSEHEALLLGNLSEIEQLTTEKEKIIGELSAEAGEDEQALKSVHEKIARNQRLLKSASQGIRAVSDRLAALRRVRGGLDTYDRSGNRQTFGNQVSTTLEKRA